MTDGLRPVEGDDGPLTVRGGVGGIRFQWEELEEAARVLSLLAVEAGDVAVSLARLDREVCELPWRVLHLQLLGAGAGLHYQDALSQLDGARTTAADNGRSLASTEERLRASLRAYRMADGVAAAAADAARAGSAATIRAVARGAISGGVVEVGPIALRNRAAGTPVAFDGTVEGVVGRLAAVEADDPGTFEVLRAGTAGSPVYVVVLPGTQPGPGEAAGSNPFDIGGIAEALAEDSLFTGAAVLDALGRAGAHPGDSLIVAGYSQGGLHAVNLAGAMGGRYDVQLVLTVGSPTGWHASGSSEYLHLEHSADAVPELDSTLNSDDRHRTTVTLHTPVPDPGRSTDGSQEPWGLGPAHKLDNYAEGARLVDASEAPSLAPATALLAAAGAAGTARRYSFRAFRRPRPAGAPGPRVHTGRREAGLGYGHDVDR
ncbi:hypothetical protein ACX80I_04400 [Arthrobacter sp. MDT3-44]